MLLTNKKITITFDTDGTNTINAIQIKKGESITLPEVKKEGFNFDGWYLEGQKVTNSTTYDKDVTLKAKWISETAKTFTITFDSDGGSKVDNIIVECGKELSLPANPTKEGYSFMSWIDKFETPILDKALLSCEDITLKANWKKEETKPASSNQVKPSSQSKQKTYKCPEGYTLDGTKCVITKEPKEKCPDGTKTISGGICATITNSARRDYSKSCEKVHVTYMSFSDYVDGKVVNWGITGCAYYKTGDSDKSTCESNGITISMSRKGTPIDDSPMESWHGILKKETLHNNNITSLQEYQKLVEDWILFYNTTRLKSKK